MLAKNLHQIINICLGELIKSGASKPNNNGDTQTSLLQSEKIKNESTQVKFDIWKWKMGENHKSNQNA